MMDKEKKNLVIRNAVGRVVEYISDGAKDIEKYRDFELDGYTLEVTADRYTKKWNRWWLTE